MSRLRAASPQPHRTSITAGFCLQHNNCIMPKQFCLHSDPRSRCSWIANVLSPGLDQARGVVTCMVWQGDKTNWAWHRNPASISWWLSTFFLTRVHSPRYGGPAPRGDLPNRRPIHFLRMILRRGGDSRASSPHTTQLQSVLNVRMMS